MPSAASQANSAARSANTKSCCKDAKIRVAGTDCVRNVTDMAAVRYSLCARLGLTSIRDSSVLHLAKRPPKASPLGTRARKLWRKLQVPTGYEDETGFHYGK